ncbi:hypothetical protein BVI2075_210002 [Burkholderia vietnamiensis]|nr:hypothetical protein BVI2075_210002 [Burkholderia vietnamiensis]CAG9234734.1 hypothetical protein BVI1335_980014 [Burkholderia vietnamiensis]
MPHLTVARAAVRCVVERAVGLGIGLRLLLRQLIPVGRSRLPLAVLRPARPNRQNQIG